MSLLLTWPGSGPRAAGFDFPRRLRAQQVARMRLRAGVKPRSVAAAD